MVLRLRSNGKSQLQLPSPRQTPAGRKIPDRLQSKSDKLLAPASRIISQYSSISGLSSISQNIKSSLQNPPPVPPKELYSSVKKVSPLGASRCTQKISRAPSIQMPLTATKQSLSPGATRAWSSGNHWALIDIQDGADSKFGLGHTKDHSECKKYLDRIKTYKATIAILEAKLAKKSAEFEQAAANTESLFNELIQCYTQGTAEREELETQVTALNALVKRQDDRVNKWANYCKPLEGQVLQLAASLSFHNGTVQARTQGKHMETNVRLEERRRLPIVFLSPFDETDYSTRTVIRVKPEYPNTLETQQQRRRQAVAAESGSWHFVSSPPSSRKNTRRF